MSVDMLPSAEQIMTFIFWGLGICTAITIICAVLELRSQHVANQCVGLMMRVGMQLVLTRQLMLPETARLRYLPKATTGRIVHIYDQPVMKKGHVRKVAVVNFGGIDVAMSTLDMKFYFAPTTWILWRVPDELKQRVAVFSR